MKENERDKYGEIESWTRESEREIEKETTRKRKKMWEGEIERDKRDKDSEKK